MRGAALLAMLLLVGAAGCTSDDESGDADTVRRNTAAAPATLEIRRVLGTAVGPTAKPGTPGGVVLPGPQGDFLDLGPVRLDSEDVAGAEAASIDGVQMSPEADASGVSETWVVNIDFTQAGSDAFGSLTAKAACSDGATGRIAIVVDDIVLSAPDVAVTCGGRITDSTQIIGEFTESEASELARRIEAGR